MEKNYGHLLCTSHVFCCLRRVMIFADQDLDGHHIAGDGEVAAVALEVFGDRNMGMSETGA